MTDRLKLSMTRDRVERATSLSSESPVPTAERAAYLLAVVDVPALLAVVDAVLALHAPGDPECPDPHHNPLLCPCAVIYCDDCGDTYPCRTVAAIREQLEVTHDYRRHAWEVYAEEADEQRGRAVVAETLRERAQEDVDRLRAELARYRSVGWAVDRRWTEDGEWRAGNVVMEREVAEQFIPPSGPNLWRLSEVFVRDPAATEGGEVHVEVHQNADGTWPERPPEADSVTWVGRGPAEGGEG